MEVHKHPHHVTHKKKWSEYLLEFLMIFLAVFLGFLAENWRENISDRKKEKEYVKGLVNDLRKDTAVLRSTRDVATNVLQATDSTIIILQKDQLSDSLVRSLYELNPRIYRVPTMQFAEQTTAQLLNAGGLRLIRSERVLDSISNYWENQKRLFIVEQNVKDKKDKAHELEYRIFFDGKFYKPSDRPFEAEITGRPVLSPNAQSILAEYLNRLITVKDVTRNYIRFVNILQKLGIGLIETIKSEYHIE
jgi:hypothetical protein